MDAITERIDWLTTNCRLTLLPLSGNVVHQQPILPTDTSLAIKAIDAVFRDAPNDVLLQLNSYVKNLMVSRGTIVKIALSDHNICFDMRCYTTTLQQEVRRALTMEYLADHQPHWIITPDLITFMTYGANRLMCEDVAKITNCTEQDLISTRETLSNIMFTGGNGILSPEYAKYQKHFSMDVTNPYFIAAVEQVLERGEVPKGIILTAINVPLGKKIKQYFSAEYGDYIQLVDE